jgi:hypothetical protein
MISSTPLSRRKALMILSSMLGLGLTKPAYSVGSALPVGAFGELRLSAIRVEVSPDLHKVAPLMLAHLRYVFADRLSPGNRHVAILIVRIDSIFFTRYVDSTEPQSNVDWMKGSGLVVGSGNRQIAEFPLLINLPAAYSGAWYLPDIDTRRMDSLCQAFAQWLRRAIGL